MPPQIQALLQNRQLVIIIAAVAAFILIGGGALLFMGGGKESETARKLNKDEMVLATVDNMGRALEIQALMAREKINLIREDVEGGKASLKFEENATMSDRDRALVTLVQSGLMDKNVGLEIFEKGDLTASREEKRIKLIRARNGELARLIRKIDPIQDASVFISMPEPTLFKRDMVPVTATVQVSLSPGEKLSREKVRSIINLLVGSIETLNAKHVSLTDTNGTVYNSVLDASDELMDKLEERDRYMEQKVRTQLDRLLGANKYVATVSTYLRETPKSTMQLNYDPRSSSIAKSAQFDENLNAQQAGGNIAAGPVSTMVPDDIDTTTGSGGRSQRGYTRNGNEVEFNAGKSQVTEEFMPGMLEEITIAVTVDGGNWPESLTMDSFKTLVARSASPMVDPDNVTVAMGKKEEIAPITQVAEPKVEVAWWVWAIGAIVAFILLILLIGALNRPAAHPKLVQQQQDEIKQLRELASTQAQQLQVTQQQAAQAIQAQQEQLTQLTASQQKLLIETQQKIAEQAARQEQAAAVVPDNSQAAEELRQTLTELKQALKLDEEDPIEDEEELGSELRSWIESS